MQPRRRGAADPAGAGPQPLAGVQAGRAAGAAGGPGGRGAAARHCHRGRGAGQRGGGAAGAADGGAPRGAEGGAAAPGRCRCGETPQSVCGMLCMCLFTWLHLVSPDAASQQSFMPLPVRRRLRAAGADAWGAASTSATTSSSSSNGAYPPSPLSSWTITSDDDGGVGAPPASRGGSGGEREPEAPPMTPEAVAASQTGAGEQASERTLAMQASNSL